MKWYSVKKFTPLLGPDYLVFTKNNEVFIANLEEIKPNQWVGVSSCSQCTTLSLTEISEVTHFCLIEPVEIEQK